MSCACGAKPVGCRASCRGGCRRNAALVRAAQKREQIYTKGSGEHSEHCVFIDWAAAPVKVCGTGDPKGGRRKEDRRLGATRRRYRHPGVQVCEQLTHCARKLLDRHSSARHREHNVVIWIALLGLRGPKPLQHRRPTSGHVGILHLGSIVAHERALGAAPPKGVVPRYIVMASKTSRAAGFRRQAWLGRLP